jgi:hypothetical protein
MNMVGTASHLSTGSAASLLGVVLMVGIASGQSHTRGEDFKFWDQGP